MSVPDFQNTCDKHSFSTSLHIIQTKNIIPLGVVTQKMVIRLWDANRGNFTLDLANQAETIVFDPQNGHPIYPNKEQFSKLDKRVQDCISKLLFCLEEEIFPIKQQRIIDILGNTVVALPNISQQETAALLSQSI